MTADKTVKHSNIALFVPHLGCPHRCSFCDQRAITGTTAALTAADVDAAVEQALSGGRYDPANGQIAFFGGSFTAIDRGYMLELLRVANRHVRLGHAAGIRVSTRPDAVSEEVLKLLRQYGVTAVELGAQSMRETVLTHNGRGHTAVQTVQACEAVRRQGMELGLQMMTGLYGDDDAGALDTARQFVALRPDTVRIYPTVVLRNTRLHRLYQSGVYRPQTVEQAVELGARLLELFIEAGILVIRFGLHSVDMGQLVDGPWHPALAQLAYGRVYLDRAQQALNGCSAGAYILQVHPAEISTMIGQKRGNIAKLADAGYKCIVKGDPDVVKYQVRAFQQEGM